MICFLLLQWDVAIYMCIAILLLEGITNWRIPILISKTRYAGAEFSVTTNENKAFTINFEAERFFRFHISFCILLGFVVFPNELWFFPWFISLSLLMAGISGICILVILFRKPSLK